jgi:3-oxoacyl-[acyl-carrier-protein] synthase III
MTLRDSSAPMVGLKAIKTYFAGRRVRVTDLDGYQELPAAGVEYYAQSGIDTVYAAAPRTGYELALGAAEQLLADGQIEADQIDLILYIRGRIPDQLVASEAMRLKHELGATSAQALAISDLGCADSSVALKLALDHHAANRAARHVLICYGHRNPEGCRFRFPVTVQGDGGFACLVSKSAGCRVLDLQLESNGAYWDLFKIDYQGKTKEQMREVCRDLRAYGFELAVESRMRFERLNQKLLQRHGLTYQDIKHVLLQNISQRAYVVYEDVIQHPISPVCRQNLAQYGHLGCADVFLNLQSGLESGLFRPGERVLVMNNSPVAAWTSFLIEI